MNFIKSTLRPGRVMAVEGKGIIKASAPGLFSDQDDPSLLPPIYPFPIGAANNISMVNVGDEVWVLSQSDNPRDLHWFRKDDHFTNDEQDELMGESVNMMEGVNVEILMHRENGAGWATIMFEDGRGILLQNNKGYINIRKDGGICLDIQQPNRCIDICGASISLGTKGGSAHTGAYGDELIKCLELIQTALETIKQAAGTNAYTKPINLALNTLPDQIKKQIPLIESPHITLD